MDLVILPLLLKPSLLHAQNFENCDLTVTLLISETSACTNSYAYIAKLYYIYKTLNFPHPWDLLYKIVLGQLYPIPSAVKKGKPKKVQVTE